jgi:hypothetical protein
MAPKTNAWRGEVKAALEDRGYRVLSVDQASADMPVHAAT